MENFTIKRATLRAWISFLIGAAMPFVTVWANGETTAFSLECPPDVTISCNDDLYNLDKYGYAYIHDYHGKRKAGKPKVIYDLNDCGKGTIKRTWTVEDYQWNVHKCTQIIYVKGGGLTEHHIIWPKDLDVEGCYPRTDPKHLPHGHGYPAYKSAKCAKPMAAYDDQVFEFGGGCKKIIRKWTVIDWCEYKPNQRPLPGYFTHYQIIKVSASEKPTLHCPKDSTYTGGRSCDSLYVKIDLAYAHSKCDSNLKITNNSPYADHKGANASGTYPVGTTKVTFKVEYGCGKDTTCSTLITVGASKGPVPYCRDGVITTLMGIDTDGDGKVDDGMVEVWAKDLDIGSWHPCGNHIPLTFSFEADSIVMNRTFTCADLGKNEVRIYVSDPNGNQSYCRTYVIIQNNNARIPDCKRDTTGGGGGGGGTGPTKEYSELGGEVYTDLLKPIPNADISMTAYGQDTLFQIYYDTTIQARLDTIHLPGGGTTVVIVIDTTLVVKYDTSYGDRIVTTITDAGGKYAFGQWLNGRRYTISASKTGPLLDGVDVMDALLLIQHLIGASTLENVYRYIAADVNNDQVVNYEDFTLLYDVVMGMQSEFAGGRNWVFVPASHVFIDPTNPWAQPIPDRVEVNPLTRDTKVNFVGVKLGDVDGNITPSFNTTVTQTRGSDTWYFDLREKNIQPGQRFTVELPLEALSAGVLRWHIPADMARMTNYRFGQAAGEFDHVDVRNETVQVIFANQSSLTIELEATSAFNLSELLSKQSLDGQLADRQGHYYRPLARFAGDAGLLEVTSFPNPFKDSWSLRVASGEAVDAVLRVYDVTGVVWMQRELSLPAGETTITMTPELLPATGLYIYELIAGERRVHGKVQKMD